MERRVGKPTACLISNHHIMRCPIGRAVVHIMAFHELNYRLSHRWYCWLPVERPNAHFMGYPITYPMR